MKKITRAFIIGTAFLVVAAFIFSCQKQNSVKPAAESELKDTYSNIFRASLKAKMTAGDFQNLDFKTALHTTFPSNTPDIVRIGFIGSSMAYNFVLLETDKTGNVSDGRIIYLNYTAEPDERSKKIHINGSMVRSALDRSNK